MSAIAATPIPDLLSALRKAWGKVAAAGDAAFFGLLTPNDGPQHCRLVWRDALTRESGLLGHIAKCEQIAVLRAVLAELTHLRAAHAAAAKPLRSLTRVTACRLTRKQRAKGGAR